MYGTIKLLDCTLRDGGYINDWKFGRNNIREIIEGLVRADVDIVETGFLRKAEDYTLSEDITRWEDIARIEKYLPQDHRHTLFSAMCIHNFYDPALLPDSKESSIRILRVTFHSYDYREGLEFCGKAMQKGYLVSCNPINIMGYADEELLSLIGEVNRIHPYAFSIVDTFGSMTQKDLNRIVSLVDHNLDQEIQLGLHLHENLSQSFSLAQNFLNQPLYRNVIIDGSLMGMGRTPGNLSLELMADYLNEYHGTGYDIDCMLDTIEDHISPLKGSSGWGYTPAYFLSARYNLHRNYAQYYLDKGNLTHKDINHILSRITGNHKAAFDAAYAELLYREYVSHTYDDTEDRRRLAECLCNYRVVVLAPGKTLLTHKKEITEALKKKNTVAIAVNFVTTEFHTDFVFFSNHKRYEKYKSSCHAPVIATSNIEGKTRYCFDYNSLTDTSGQGCNSLIMLLRLLSGLGVRHVWLAGADGYRDDGNDYYDSSIHSFHAHAHNYNYSVAGAIQKQKLKADFITPSFYDIQRT